MSEPKGFVSWADAGPRKVVDGIEVAPDRVKVYFNLQKECLSVIDAETQRAILFPDTHHWATVIRIRFPHPTCS